MNRHHYKVIFDHDLQRSVVVSELAKSCSKPASEVCVGDVVVFSDRAIGGSLQKVRSKFQAFCEMKKQRKNRPHLYHPGDVNAG